MRISDWSSDVCSSDLNSHRQLHGALLDAQLLAEAYLALTSGQGEIGFDALAEAERRDAAQSVARLAAVDAPRPRVAVSAAEMEAHEARLARLRAKAGRAVWDEAGVVAFSADRKSTRLNSSHSCASRM